MSAPGNQARNAVFATSRLAVFVLVMSFITGCESVLTDIATRVRYAVRDAAAELQASGDDTKATGIRPNGWPDGYQSGASYRLVPSPYKGGKAFPCADIDVYCEGWRHYWTGMDSRLRVTPDAPLLAPCLRAAWRKRLKNLPDLRKIGFAANRRLLDVQRVSHDCSIGEDAFDQVVRPVQVDGQRASPLRFGDARVQALFPVLGLFGLQLRGFNNQEIRSLLAPLLGFDPAITP